MPGDTSDTSSLEAFLPHGICLLWREDLLLLHVLSDALIALSYFSIPIMLVYFVWQRADLKFRRIFLLFGAFILACGATHLLGIWTLWHPDYLLEGWIKFLTAITSLATAVVLWGLIPELLRIPSPSTLEQANQRLQDEITERMRHERQVTLLNSQLEKRVDERTQSLSALNELLRQEIAERKQAEEKLRDRERRKDEFLATLAHELRNPLAPIRNAIELLKLQPGQVGMAVDLIGRQLDQLTHLVDDLLDMARITHGQITLRKTPVDLADILRQAAESARPLIDMRQQSLTLALPNEPLVADADPVRMVQVVASLLDNAAKFTGRKGHIQLSLERQEGEALIEVQDNGVGIASAKLESVFELFVQGDHSGNLAQGGLGLGLTLVRRLLAMHGGTIKAQSDGLGLGSRFLARLPLPPTVGEIPRSEPGSLLASKTHRILVVDDNQDAAESLKLLLQTAGHEVHVEYDGFSALKSAAAFQPTAAILDIGMADMNGYELAERLRQNFPSLLLIALTGYDQEEDLSHARNAGFDHHFLKPLHIEALITVFDTTEPGIREGEAAPIAVDVSAHSYDKTNPVWA